MDNEVRNLVAEEIGVKPEEIRDIEAPREVPEHWETMPVHVYFFTGPSKQIEIDLNSKLAHLLL